MCHDPVELEHVVFVKISVTPFQHLVVGSDLLKGSVPMDAFEPDDVVLPIGSDFVIWSGLDDLGPSLLPIVVGICDESPVD